MLKTNYDVYSDELYHHGILGQKWGVRRYQNKDGSWTSAGRERYGSGRSGKNEDTQYGDGAFLAVTAAMLAIDIAAIAISNHNINVQESSEMVMLYEDRDFNTVSDIPKIKGKNTTADNLKKVNPDYPKDGTVSNCTFCTTAMVMREKGYDVKANSTETGKRIGSIEGFFEDAHFEDKTFDSKKDASKKIAEQGEGAYGNLLLFWPYGGGHSVMYKVEKGETIIYDGQSGERSPLTEYGGGYFANNMQICQLNNKEPTQKVCAAIQKTSNKYSAGYTEVDIRSYANKHKDKYKTERQSFKTIEKANKDYNKELRRQEREKRKDK